MKLDPFVSFRFCLIVNNSRKLQHRYSMQFGPANLPRVAELCRKQFGPDYEVTWTEGGY